MAHVQVDVVRARNAAAQLRQNGDEAFWRFQGYSESRVEGLEFRAMHRKYNGTSVLEFRVFRLQGLGAVAHGAPG